MLQRVYSVRHVPERVEMAGERRTWSDHPEASYCLRVPVINVLSAQILEQGNQDVGLDSQQPLT